MAECRLLMETVAEWGGAVVPARVLFQDGGFTKSSIKSWPARATPDKSMWPPEWGHWGGTWWAALCPRTGGLVALDLDGEEAIEAYRTAIRVDPSLWPEGALAYRTPGHGGGMHVVWRWPRDLPAFSRMVVTLECGGQVDLRGESTFLLLYGAPRPDLPSGENLYQLISRPGEDGPPPAPEGLVPWMEVLSGSFYHQAGPTLEYKQMSPTEFKKMAKTQGGKITVDRHSALFSLASYLRVRSGTRTFETLAAELWKLAEIYIDYGQEGEESWQTETLRVARNASKYLEERDRQQMEAAKTFTTLWQTSSRT